jgi:hypothetical protein
MIQLKEMAKIGTIDTQVGKTGSYEIWIYTNDGGDKPHFHIINDQTGFSSCVEICNAAYFKHEGKEDELNHRLKKSLVYFLKSKSKKRNFTNWEYLCLSWDTNNSNRELPEEIYDNMPDYMTL